MIEQRTTKVLNKEQVELKMLSLSIFDWSILALSVFIIIFVFISLTNFPLNYRYSISKCLFIIPIYKLFIVAAIGLCAQYYKYKSLETQRISILDRAIILNIFVVSLIISSFQQISAILARFYTPNCYSYYSVIFVSVMTMFLMRSDLVLKNAAFMTMIASVDFVVHILAKLYCGVTFNVKQDIIMLLNSAVASIVVVIICSIGATLMHKVFTVYSLREAKLRHYKAIAETDALTKISNRRAFDLDLELLATAHVKTVAIAMFDIDDFKKFNDEYGHSVGDYVLEQVGKLISSFNDYNGIEAYRYGGEEMTVVFSYLGATYNVEEQIELFRHAVSNVKIPNVKRNITISAGLAFANIGNVVKGDARRVALKQLIEAADKNLYEAKHSGKNRLCTSYEKHIGTAKQGGK